MLGMTEGFVVGTSKAISSAVTKRLPRYYRYLSELREQGTERISSKELSERMQVTASQIRQDLNNFGGFGQQGYGYNVEHLYTEIGKILGLNQVRKIVIIGAGHLGQALANFADFEKRGFQISGVFDSNPAVIGTKVNNHIVKSMDDLYTVIRQEEVSIAVLTIPKESAVKVADELVELGIVGFWNFALVDLNLPKHVHVENVHLEESLMNLAYNISAGE